MRSILSVVAFLFISSASAQKSVCMAAGKSPGSINYNEEVNRLIPFAQSKAVIVGEMHNGNFNPELQYHLITNLNEHFGFRHVFLEMGAACAWRFNQFVKTGDTAFLRNKKMVANYGQWPTFWKRMHAYNQARPDSLKIVFHGVDFERTDVFGTILELAPPGKTPPASISAAMDTARAHSNDEPFKICDLVDGKLIEYDNSAFVNVLAFIQEEFRNNPADTKQFFGENYGTIKIIAENKSKVTVMPKPRNRTMFASIRQTVSEQQIDKFIGIFGAQHTIYTQRTSITNAVAGLPKMQKNQVLNLQEIVYSDNRETKVDTKIMQLNSNCKVTVMPASDVPGYKRSTDYVIIGNASK